MTDFFGYLIEASKKEDFADVIERWMATGVFKTTLPEVQVMTECEHPIKWHPEGDTVWDHVLASLKNLDLSDFDSDQYWIIRLSTFFHDIGKPSVKKIIDGKVHYFGHDAAGLRVFEEICERHNVTDEELIENIKFPIKNHMKLHLFDKMRQKKIDRLVEDEKWSILKGVGMADIYSRKYNKDGSLSNVDCDAEYSMLNKYPHK